MFDIPLHRFLAEHMFASLPAPPDKIGLGSDGQDKHHSIYLFIVKHLITDFEHLEFLWMGVMRRTHLLETIITEQHSWCGQTLFLDRF